MSHNIHFYIMKQSLHLLVFLTTFTLSVGSAMAQGEPSKGRVPEHTAFDNVSIGVEASTTGIGLSVATPLHRAFTLRGGFNVLPFSYRYTYDDFDPLMVAGTEVSVPGLGLKASSRMYTGHLIVDWVPFRRGTSTFFLAAGLYFGGSRLLDVTGRFDPAELAAAGQSPPPSYRHGHEGEATTQANRNKPEVFSLREGEGQIPLSPPQKNR